MTYIEWCEEWREKVRRATIDTGTGERKETDDIESSIVASIDSYAAFASVSGMLLELKLKSLDIVPAFSIWSNEYYDIDILALVAGEISSLGDSPDMASIILAGLDTQKQKVKTMPTLQQITSQRLKYHSMLNENTIIAHNTQKFMTVQEWDTLQSLDSKASKAKFIANALHVDYEKALTIVDLL